MNVATILLVFWAMVGCVALVMMLCAYASSRPFKSVEIMALAGLFLLFSLLVMTGLYIITEAGFANMRVVDWQ